MSNKPATCLKVTLHFTHEQYLTLALRYKELASGGCGGGGLDIPFDIDGHPAELDTDKIDVDYMNYWVKR